MPYTFSVVAVDYDGTIAQHDSVHPAALDAIAELRRQRRKVLLCTGRRVEELRDVFPDVDRHFDAIVAENGGLIVMASEIIWTADPLPNELDAVLGDAGVPFERGHVLIATHAHHAPETRKAIEELGLEAQLVYNRGALMVLPSGVSKGSGLLHAFGLLEVSRHSAIGIGDAENDHSLLQACEIGVAVGDAVSGLKAHADLCLDKPNGAGVAEFLAGPVLRGELSIRPRRWQIELGRSADGTPAMLPGSGVNVLIAGASCSGKSRLAGLIVERLVNRQYTVCVLDAEGDHANLESIAGVVTVGGQEPLPRPERIAALVRNRFSSVVMDMSLLGADEKRTYTAAVLRELHDLRRERGYPHWIVVEEADQLLPEEGLSAGQAEAPIAHCLVTHRPAVLPETVLARMDVVIAMPGAERLARIPANGMDDGDGLDRPFILQQGEALLATADGVLKFEVGPRMVSHVRHRQKYLHAQVPPNFRFYFGHADGNRASAGNVAEFRDEIRNASSRVLRDHLEAGDFSRWVLEVIADDELGARLRGIERWFHNDPDADVEAARTAVIAAIRDRYVQ